MKESLLSHIAGNFVSQYENVANSSVCYLLNQYPAACLSLNKLLSLTELPTQYVTEQSSTKSNGRPDVTGLDANGKKVVIIEGKFWANLTDNQPANYLTELGNGGKFLFLAPDRRIESLRAEIKKRLGYDEKRIEVYSWMSFLSLIESENSRVHDGDLASDLVQLKALCGKMDEEGMPPLNMTDLDPMNGRICYQLSELIDDCNNQLRLWDESDFTGLKSIGFKLGYGFYFRALNFGCFLCISTSDWFKRKSHTPIWLNIYTQDFKNDQQIYYNLNNYDPDNSYNDNGKPLYGIALKPGMDRNQVIEHIVTQVKSVLHALRSTSQGASAE